MQQLQQLRPNLNVQVSDTRDIAARAVEAGDEADLHRIADGHENYWDGRGSGLCRDCCGCCKGGNYEHLMPDQISCQSWQATVLILSPTVFHCEVLTLDRSGLIQALLERGD